METEKSNASNEMMTWNEICLVSTLRMRIWNNTFHKFSSFGKERKLKIKKRVWACEFRVCARHRVNFLIRFYPALCCRFFFIERREIRWWLGDCSKTIETNIEHNTFALILASVCVLIYLFTLFLLCATQTIDFVRTALFALLLFHRRHTRCITVLCSLFARIEYFFLIWSRMEMSIVRQQPVWLFAIFDSIFIFNRISTQIFAIHMWTWLSSEALAQMAYGTDSVLRSPYSIL